jgi:two-component system LytT family response regulator
MIRSVIIEDETKTREGLEHLLNKYCPGINVCGMADDFEQGYSLIRQENPELIFIDIQLNSMEGTGMELVQALNLESCAVIFISGYKDYAVEAFRLKAVDYLLKPIRINHLVEAVEKAKKHLELQKTKGADPAQKPRVETFHIHSQSGFVLVRHQDIIRSEADGAYTHFYVNGKTEKVTSSMNIGQIEAKLGPEFLRVHKSHIINKTYILSYSKGEGLLVKMSDQSEVPVSRTQKELFFKWLG